MLISCSVKRMLKYINHLGFKHIRSSPHRQMFGLLGSVVTYLDAAGHRVGHVLLTAAFKPMKDEVSVLFHLPESKAGPYCQSLASRATFNHYTMIKTLFSTVGWE